MLRFYLEGTLKRRTSTLALAYTSKTGRVLNVNAAPSFATRWLLPNLPKFKSQFPEVSVELQPTMEIGDLGDGNTDLAIRHGSGKWSGLESAKLFDEMIIPVAAVSLSKTLDKEKFWRGQTLLSASPRKGEWEHWFKARRGRKSENQEIIYYPTQALALDAAVSGLGIALADYRLVAGDLKCGRLVQLQAEPTLNKRAFYAVYRKGSAADARIRVFCDWLSDSLI